MYVDMWALKKLFRQGCTRVRYPIWLRGRVHISVNVLRRVAAKLAVHSAVNVIIWPFSILSRISIIGVFYCLIYDLTKFIMWPLKKSCNWQIFFFKTCNFAYGLG